MFNALLIALALTQEPAEWKKMYLRDLDSLRAAIAANHPGAIDTANPGFALVLDRAYREGRILATQVKDVGSFNLALTRFINQFEDEHLQIGFASSVDSLREAGVYVSYRAGEFYVVEADSARYPIARVMKDSRVRDCDGVAAKDVFRERVLWWRGRAKIEADWYRYAPYFFLDYGAPAPKAPAKCMFVHEGMTMSVPLQWRTIARQQVNATFQRLYPVRARSISTQRIDEQKLWFSVPTFSINAEPNLTIVRTAFDSLRAFVRDGKWDLIVFDLRGNSGGSSTWGDSIARIVFGDQWGRQAAAYLSDGVYTEWRLSEDNIKSVRGIQAQIEKRDGVESQSARNFKTMVDSMEAAWKRGVKYYSTQRARTGVLPPESTPVPGRVVVITTPSCFSACLDFLDRMRLHKAVVQVGQTTGVDTNYMENWGGPISSRTRWGHPLKVYRNRRRANNEAYPPHVQYEDSLEDDAALRFWILNNYRSWNPR